MKSNRQYQINRHKFATPLLTAHGNWGERESIVLREESNDGRISFGELCPTPGFITSSIKELLPLVEAWKAGLDFQINPLMQSAISCMASEIWNPSFKVEPKSDVFSAELITFFKSVGNIPTTYKKKIGIKVSEIEIKEVKQILNSISNESMIRLDANESLGIEELLRWNEAFAHETRIQFIEQPFPREKIDELLAIEKELTVPLALDESLVWKNDFSFFEKRGWQGYYVIKPCLFPNWGKMIAFIRSQPLRSVISTVFESPFGYEAVVRCAFLSNQVAGLDRSLFTLNAKEIPQHHQRPLSSENVPISVLDKLWGEL